MEILPKDRTPAPGGGQRFKVLTSRREVLERLLEPKDGGLFGAIYPKLGINVSVFNTREVLM